MGRYLQARPEGVLAWLCVKPPSLERRLFEHLLSVPDAVELNVPALAATFCLPPRTVAYALFALSRQSSVAVQDGAQPVATENPAMQAAACQGLAALEHDLMEIACAQGEIMLASDDGFCIAQAGLSPQRAQSLAARLPLGNDPAPNFHAALCFGDRTLHFYASPGIDLKHPLMLRLGARLLQACQRPAATTGH